MDNAGFAWAALRYILLSAMILVTGGTGFVGQEVVKKLLSLGYKVRLLVRNPRRARQFADHPQVEVVQGDLLRPETLSSVMTDVQAVIHLVGILVETPTTSYRQAHVEATRNLLAFAHAAGVTRWLQMSAAGTRPYASSQYHLTKWQAEELVRQSEFDWTILRPSLIYGYDERDRLLNMLRRMLSWPFDFMLLYSFPLLDGGRPLIQPVSVREVAHCFAHGLSKNESIGRIFELVGPVPLSWREMVGKVATALGKSVVYEEIPLMLILRKMLWISVLLIPIMIVAGLIMGELSLAKAEIGAALWAVLLIVAYRWRQLILFNVPGEPLRIITEGLDSFLPQGLRFGGLLKMAGEDNIGDSRPAAEIFDYEPESFDRGLRQILGNEKIL
jgi:NADH dehydrogenase